MKLLVGIYFIDYQENGFFRTSQQHSYIFIHTGKALPGINHEDDAIGLLNRHIYLLLDLLLKDITRLINISTSINHRKLHSVPVRFPIMPVTGHPAGEVDNSITPPDQAVEKGGFTNIGTTNDCNNCHRGV